MVYSSACLIEKKQMLHMYNPSKVYVPTRRVVCRLSVSTMSIYHLCSRFFRRCKSEVLNLEHCYKNLFFPDWLSDSESNGLVTMWLWRLLRGNPELEKAIFVASSQVVGVNKRKYVYNSAGEISLMFI